MDFDFVGLKMDKGTMDKKQKIIQNNLIKKVVATQ